MWWHTHGRVQTAKKTNAPTDDDDDDDDDDPTRALL
jgi:hypothetical protein